MLYELVNFLAKIYKDNLSSIINDAILSTILFFQLVPSSPSEASHYGATAISTVISLFLIIYYLIKSIRKIDKALSVASDIISWIINIVKNAADHFGKTLSNALKSTFDAIFSLSTYSSLVSWCGMIDNVTEKTIIDDYIDGRTHILYQKNIGISIIFLTLWSSCSFAFAIYSSATSFSNNNNSIAFLTVTGAVLYGIMILTLDRSIVAPFLPSDQYSLRSISSYFDKFKYYYLPIIFSITKVTLRIVIAMYVAKFTALPISLLILHGGVQDQYLKKYNENIAKVENETKSIYADKFNFINSKQQSSSCIIANESVKKSQQRIDDMARSGCKSGYTVCPKEGTEYLENKHKEYLNNQKDSCFPSSDEIRSYDDRISILTKKMSLIKIMPFPDILTAAIILDELAVKESGNIYFHPVAATYYLLFIIELFPMLIKFWRSPLICICSINYRARRLLINEDYDLSTK